MYREQYEAISTPEQINVVFLVEDDAWWESKCDELRRDNEQLDREFEHMQMLMARTSLTSNQVAQYYVPPYPDSDIRIKEEAAYGDTIGPLNMPLPDEDDVSLSLPPNIVITDAGMELVSYKVAMATADGREVGEKEGRTVHSGSHARQVRQRPPP